MLLTCKDQVVHPRLADPLPLEHLVTTNPEDFAANARRAESILTGALDSWKNGLDSVTNQFRAFPSVGNLPQLDATEAVERQFAFITQVVELNHQYARQLAPVPLHPRGPPTHPPSPPASSPRSPTP